MSAWKHIATTGSNVTQLGAIRSRVWVEAEKATAPLRVEVAVMAMKGKLETLKSELMKEQAKREAKANEEPTEDELPWEFG